MGRVIGLDIGSRTMGIAISDGLKMLAHSKENYRFEEKDFHTAITHLKTMLDDVETIVVGYPKRLDGTKSQTTEMIEDFVDMLKLEVDLPIKLIDERLTTKMAVRQMIDTNIKKRKRKENKDKIAAVIILQSYLDAL